MCVCVCAVWAEQCSSEQRCKHDCVTYTLGHHTCLNTASIHIKNVIKIYIYATQWHQDVKIYL